MERSRTAARKNNEKMVLSTIFHHGPISRVKVAKLAALSKPTVSSIVDDLVRAGLVAQYGTRQGKVGRSAALFHVDGTIAYAVGVDLGGSHLRIAVVDIHGNVVGEKTVDTDLESPRELESQIVALCHETAGSGVAWRSVRAVAIGVPGVVDEPTGGIRLAPNIPPISGLALRQALAAGEPRDVVIENDVNLAAVSEFRHGLARGVDNFVFVEVGTGLGAGIFLDGRLCKGADGGAAGEIGYMPIGDDPFERQDPRRGALEEKTSGPGIAREAQRRIQDGATSILGLNSDAHEVFDAAAQDDPVGLAVVDQAARYLALGIASLATVISPALVILGGGVGTNPQLIQPVRRYVQQLLPEPLRIEQTAAGTRGTLLGATEIGLSVARERILSVRPEQSNGAASGAPSYG
jgi:predicted NBD/HSP70 family sugar kinase